MNASYIRINQLIQKLPISKASIWRKVKNHTFPAPVKLSVGITAWRTADIETWLSQCKGVSK
jgi:predicted DNA-binding transcriptional regulator AlpA